MGAPGPSPARHALVVLARAPSAPGKSRLTSHLSSARAQDLRAALLLDTLDVAHAVGVPVTVAFTPGDAREEMTRLVGGAALITQRGDDLGERMGNAIADTLASADVVALIGSDVPTLPAEYVSDALAMIEHADVVLGPSEDGGFYLVAARRDLSALFAGIEWSTTVVLRRVVDAAHASGLTVGFARSWWDVDTSDDLRRVLADGRAGVAARTRTLGFGAFAAVGAADAFGGVPPLFLQIYREELIPGSRDAYGRIEDDITRLCVEHGCPHPYLGAEKTGDPAEVWFFNGFASLDEQQEAGRQYAANTALTTALIEAAARKRVCTQRPSDVTARHRPDLSRGAPWLLGRGRFLVVISTTDASSFDGATYEASDGTLFVITSAMTRDEAERQAATAPARATVLEVRPNWSTPAKGWIAADPAFWAAYPPPGR